MLLLSKAFSHLAYLNHIRPPRNTYGHTGGKDNEVPIRGNPLLQQRREALCHHHFRAWRLGYDGRFYPPDQRKPALSFLTGGDGKNGSARAMP